MESNSKLIPLHLFGGTLGVGKTTAVRRYVEHSLEYVAVIVNDFGESGYDAGLLSSASSRKFQVENVPGGCLCCTSAAQLRPALEAICAIPEVARIIIEPSGVALLDPLISMLQEAAPECGFELRSVVVLFDALKTRPASLELIPYWRHLADRADIAVVNRCDQAPPAAADALVSCLQSWTPAKHSVVKTDFGELSPDLFEIQRKECFSDLKHRAHAGFPPVGTFRSDGVFGLSRLREILQDSLMSLERFKGVFDTDQGRVCLEVACGELIQRPAFDSVGCFADWIGVEDFSDRLQEARCAVSL